MRHKRRAAIIGTGIAALLAAVAEIIGAPQAARVVLGLPLVLLLPGFAAVCAVLPGRELSRGELVLASLGSSLAITTCISVLLAATPIGLSTRSAAAILGVGTAAVAGYAWRRSRLTEAMVPGRGVGNKESTRRDRAVGERFGGDRRP